MIVQMSVFTGAAFILLLMRSYDLTAGLCVLALAFSAVGGGGPLLGEERILPLGSGILTVFAWIASPLAFPTIAWRSSTSRRDRACSIACRGCTRFQSLRHCRS